MTAVTSSALAIKSKSPFSGLRIPGRSQDVAFLKANDATLKSTLMRTAELAGKLNLGAEAGQTDLANLTGAVNVVKNLSALVRLATETAAVTSVLVAGAKYQPFKTHLSKIVLQVGTFISQLQDELKLSPIVRALGKTNEDILFQISDNGKSNMTSLSKALGVSTAAMTGQIDRLEKFPVLGDQKIKLVERQVNPDDRRENIIGLTEEGKIVVEEARISRAMTELQREINAAIKLGTIDSSIA